MKPEHRPFYFELNPLAPLTFATIGSVLLAVAILATWLRARRASGIDPMTSMREG